jgi:hypothetical protein
MEILPFTYPAIRDILAQCFYCLACVQGSSGIPREDDEEDVVAILEEWITENKQVMQN